MRATSEDAHDIAQVHVLAWQAAYEGIVPAEHLAIQSVAKREAAWREAIATGTPEILVAKADDQLVGWIAFGPSRDKNAGSKAAEVWAIYVAPSHWSRGVGRLLWLHARERLAEQGYESVSVWVLAENTRAMKFYRAAGFVAEPTGQKEVMMAGKSLQELRYETALNG
ncbi:GNAT family acetyltransferase [Sulfurifustis variabilis]|uniref:GNAT family acetyltransferase n=1 Tax=Sulfurifustis variabilis TaxID=1675686 RepID=A0A1B4V7Y9_9GAMM|nr:GNAT family N-acetyltransferase [Sulfurifustis variabilis]BAU49643.1 GNAT family acetyltransferase [Sulfurifustis variabilis]